MGLFTPKELEYDPSVRQTGFNRYKQLISLYGADWFKINLFTVLGALPLATGIAFGVMSSSVLVLIPVSLLGGAVFGPFLAGLFDAILRGMRDDPGNWWENYKKSWKQNWKGSLIPGALTGLIVGMHLFMGFLLYWSQVFPGWGTVALYLFSGILFFIVTVLYWPQLVLFDLKTGDKFRNLILFASKYLWKVLGTAVLQLLWWGLTVLFAPWTLFLVPFLGFWFILFVSLLRIYDQLNQELHIEELFYPDRAKDLTDEEEW